MRRFATGRRSMAFAALLTLASGLAMSAPATPASAATAEPVVIAAGSFAPEIAYEPMASRLRAKGFKVFIYKIPTPLADIAATAPSLATFIDQVRASTGSAKVDVVNHSQSGLLTRHVIKYLGGASKIDTVISLSGLHQGSTLANLGQVLGLNCLGVVICQQLLPGSTYLTNLNAGTQAYPGIHYVNIASTSDVLAIPYSNNYMTGTGDITNRVLQSQCPLRFVGHLGLAVDGAIADGIVDGLRKEPIRFNCFAI